jgi:hypothetical protein
MTYELAKKLKEAGFIQETELGCRYIDRDNDYAFVGGWDSDNSWFPSEQELYCPTLSELIEACGDIVLYKHPKINTWKKGMNNRWIAGLPYTDSTKNCLCATDLYVDFSIRNGCIGTTSEEAVANLWLVLNKKS